MHAEHVDKEAGVAQLSTLRVHSAATVSVLYPDGHVVMHVFIYK